MPFNSRHWKTCRSCNRFYATKICLQTNSFDVTLASSLVPYHVNRCHETGSYQAAVRNIGQVVLLEIAVWFFIYLLTIIYGPEELWKIWDMRKAMMYFFYFCGIMMYYSATTTATSLVRSVRKRIDKAFANEFVEKNGSILSKLWQSFHCDLFSVNLNIYRLVCLECGRRM